MTYALHDRSSLRDFRGVEMAQHDPSLIHVVHILRQYFWLAKFRSNDLKPTLHLSQYCAIISLYIHNLRGTRQDLWIAFVEALRLVPRWWLGSVIFGNISTSSAEAIVAVSDRRDWTGK